MCVRNTNPDKYENIYKDINKIIYMIIYLHTKNCNRKCWEILISGLIGNEYFLLISIKLVQKYKNFFKICCYKLNYVSLYPVDYIWFITV